MSNVSSSGSGANPYQTGTSMYKMFSDLAAVDPTGAAANNGQGAFTAADVAKAALAAQQYAATQSAAGNTAGAAACTDEFVMLSNLLQTPNGGTATNGLLYNGQSTISGTDLDDLAGLDGNSGLITNNDITDLVGQFETADQINANPTDLTNIAAGTNGQTTLTAVPNSSSGGSGSNSLITQVLEILLSFLTGSGNTGGGTNPGYPGGGYPGYPTGGPEYPPYPGYPGGGYPEYPPYYPPYYMDASAEASGNTDI